MEGSQIQDILTQNPFTKNTFGGVYAIDELDQLHSKKNINSYVINLDKAKEVGSHWVALLLRKGKENIYFDSYGLPPVDKSVYSILGKKFVHNTMQLQYPLSTTCGQWCIFFILLQSMHIPLSRMQRLFSKTKLLRNDHKVNYYIYLLYKKMYKVIDRLFLEKQLCRRKLSKNKAVTSNR